MFFKSFFSCEWHLNGEIIFFILRKHLVKCATIERSPDHWWVTTCRPWILSKTSFDWKVTRSLVSYDRNNIRQIRHRSHWKVTRSLVSYDLSIHVWLKVAILKGHQIIGELRLTQGSYSNVLLLKGHQIIGELRLTWCLSIRHQSDWKVTRSLVSYD